MLRSVLSVMTLLAFMTAFAVFAAPETATQKSDNDKAEFQQKAKAKFDEYDMKFRQWSEKAKGESEKVYQEQKNRAGEEQGKRPQKYSPAQRPGQGIHREVLEENKGADRQVA